MFSAVHSDRSGRVVASDYGAAIFDGAATRPFADAVPLPAGAELVTLVDRQAIGFDRSGRPHPLGTSRFAVAAIAPPGSVRTGYPAWTRDGHALPLKPRAYAALAGAPDGSLVVAATPIEVGASFSDPRTDPSLGARVSATLREDPASRLVRQLARCAREYHCRAAASAFFGAGDCALPVAAPANERAPGPVSLIWHADAAPAEPAAFHPTAEEVADFAVRHFARGGVLASFGRACEGEPLLAARLIADATAAIRAKTDKGTVHLETNGSQPAAVRRLVDAGLDSIAIRIASARPDTYDRIHGPRGYRLTDVRASFATAAATSVALSLIVMILPGLTDRDGELDAIAGLAASLPPGGQLLLRDLSADPQPALALVPSSDAPLGIGRALERLRADAPHLRIGTLVRPPARV
jgi:pyruvate-formate lyase-activating enzyme